MADLATPAAAAISTVNAGADDSLKSTTTSNAPSTRPIRPDEEAFKSGAHEKEQVLDKAKKKQVSGM